MPYEGNNPSITHVERIAAGGFGEVHKMKNNEDETLFARKVIRIFGEITKDDIENETRALSALCNGKCRYLVQVLQHGWLVDMSLYFIDMEYCQATLEDVIKILHRDDRKTQPVSGNPKNLSFERKFTCLGNQITSLPHEEPNTENFKSSEYAWNVIGPILDDISAGLIYVHQQGFVHRDLKPRNVLFSSLHNCWKLADFGSSSQATSKRLHTTCLSRGTQGYRAPEVLEHPGPGHFNSRSDMFSFGCIIVELVTGQKLFESDLAVVRFAERPSWATELPSCWPKANFNEPLYRLRRLTTKLIAAKPSSRLGSLETRIRLQDIRNGVDRMVHCDDCGDLKIEWERCNHISLVMYVPTALGPVSG